MLESLILAHEGRFLETILKAERGMASRGCRLVANALGRFGTPSARHYDLAARSIAARIGRKCPRWKHGPRPKIAMVERRKARVPRHGTQGRLASAPARSVIACPPDAAASGRLSALRPPLIRVEEIGKDPGAT